MQHDEWTDDARATAARLPPVDHQVAGLGGRSDRGTLVPSARVRVIPAVDGPRSQCGGPIDSRRCVLYRADRDGQSSAAVKQTAEGERFGTMEQPHPGGSGWSATEHAILVSDGHASRLGCVAALASALPERGSCRGPSDRRQRVQAPVIEDHSFFRIRWKERDGWAMQSPPSRRWVTHWSHARLPRRRVPARGRRRLRASGQTSALRGAMHRRRIQACGEQTEVPQH